MRSVIDILCDYIYDIIDTLYDKWRIERLYNFCIRHRVKQRIFGLGFIFLGVIVGWVEAYPGVHDLTFAIVLISIGLFLIFTSHNFFESQ